MAISTARDVIKQALKALGVLAAGQEMSNEDASDGLDKLNAMLGMWSTDSLITTSEVQESHNLVANTGLYTIGSGLTIDTTKPIKITSAFIRDSTTDYPVAIVSRDIYNMHVDKSTLKARPTELFYDPGVSQQTTQTGTIYLYAIPDSAYTLYIISEKPLTEFSSLTTTYTFPATYKLALIYNLAIVLAPDYERAPSNEVKRLADDSLTGIRRMNALNKMEIVRVKIPGMELDYQDPKAG